MPSLPSPLEPAAGAGQRHGLVHDPFANAQVLVDPLVHVLVLARDLFALDSQAGRALHASKKGRDQDRIECVVGETAELRPQTKRQ